MAWNPDADIPNTPLTKPELRDVRRVLRWFEHREYLRAGIASWIKWLIGLPFVMLSLWQLIQLIEAHLK